VTTLTNPFLNIHAVCPHASPASLDPAPKQGIQSQLSFHPPAICVRPTGSPAGPRPTAWQAGSVPVYVHSLAARLVSQSGSEAGITVWQRGWYHSLVGRLVSRWYHSLVASSLARWPAGPRPTAWQAGSVPVYVHSLAGRLVSQSGSEAGITVW
jgi:hypothetical protein